MTLRGTDPESYITEITLVYEDYTASQVMQPEASPSAGTRRGNNLNGCKDSCPENCSSQGQNQAFTISFVPAPL